MSANAVSVEGHAGAVPGLPVPVDLADEWLADALGLLLDACEVPKAALPELLEPAADRAGPEPPPSDSAAARRARLDAARLAIVIGALAVEARLNRVLKLRDADDWGTFAHLVPLEKLELAPKLLRGVDSAPEQSELSRLAAELFELRAELVEAGLEPSAALEVADEPDQRFLPGHARTMVEASAQLCALLATLAGRDGEAGTARLTGNAARALAERAEACSIMSGPIAERRDWGFDWDVDFPPDIVGS